MNGTAIMDLASWKDCQRPSQNLRSPGAFFSIADVSPRTYSDVNVTRNLKKKFNFHAVKDKATNPWLSAIKKGTPAVVQRLMSDGFTDINLKSEDGLTALHFSILNNQPSVVEMLLESGRAKVNALARRNISAVHLAAIHSNVPALRHLVEFDGTDVNVQSTWNGWTPLHFALSLQQESVAKELLRSNRINVNVFGKGRVAPLHLAALKDSSLVSELIKKGADLDLPTEEGFTALHLATINGNHQTMKTLIRNGANVNAKTAQGSTPLHLAVAQGSLREVKCIYSFEQVRLDCNLEKYQTALQLAKQCGHQDVADFLEQIIPKQNIQLKDDPNVAEAVSYRTANPQSSLTSLDQISRDTCRETFKYLLETGANVLVSVILNDILLLMK